MQFCNNVNPHEESSDINPCDDSPMVPSPNNDMLDWSISTPILREGLSTPLMTNESESEAEEKSTNESGQSSPIPENTISMMEMENVSFTEQSDASIEGEDEHDPQSILRQLKNKNADRPVIGQININFLAPKFEPLVSIFKENVDLLMVSETKVDDSYPTEQFKIEGYSKPIRMDRNCHGGGIMIFSRDGLPCHKLPSQLPSDIECTFLEMRVRQSKWLIVGGYNPHKKNISYFLSHVSKELDKYLCKYDNLLLVGDWNSAVNETEMKDFCEIYNL